MQTQPLKFNTFFIKGNQLTNWNKTQLSGWFISYLQENIDINALIDRKNNNRFCHLIYKSDINNHGIWGSFMLLANIMLWKYLFEKNCRFETGQVHNFLRKYSSIYFFQYFTLIYSLSMNLFLNFFFSFLSSPLLPSYLSFNSSQWSYKTYYRCRYSILGSWNYGNKRFH